MAAAKKTKADRNRARKEARRREIIEKRAQEEGIDLDTPETKYAFPIQVNDATFDKEVLDSEVPVLVDFWAEWCGPCKSLAPSLERLAVDAKGDLKVVKYNTEKNKRVASEMNIRSLPTLVLFKDGEVLDAQMGAVPYPRLVGWLQKQLVPKRSLLGRLFGSGKAKNA